MEKSFDFVKNISEFSLEQKRKFYVLLGHNLTVSVRAICHEPNYSDYDKIVGMKEINEIMHRLIFRIEELHKISTLGQDSWTEKDFWTLLQHHCSKNYEVLAGNVDWAIKSSYDYCVKNEPI
jgi:hypothetical protein